jgi:hypothetical protein
MKEGTNEDFWEMDSLIVVFYVHGLCWFKSIYAESAVCTVPSLDPNKALVYFMRPSGIGFAINFQIWDGDHFIGLSQAKSYFGYQCEPGKHLFIGIAENKRGLEANLEAGKTYYALTQVRMGGWRARMAFIPVTRGSEYWNTVETYRTELNYIEAKEDMLMQWETQKKAEAQEIIAFLRTAEGQQYILSLNNEDGR